MKKKPREHTVTIKCFDNITLDTRELAFLRTMAKHCIATDMAGSLACERLVKLVDQLDVPEDRGPVCGIFE